MSKDFGLGWSNKKVNLIEKKYKNFLYLNWKYNKNKIRIVPTFEIDEFWHQHILDTKAYRKHSRYIFGKYLDHDPYFGLTDASEFELFTDAFEETQKLYYKNFREKYA